LVLTGLSYFIGIGKGMA